MTTTYQELEEKLVDYVYDELGPSDRAAFEEGLKEHPDLADEARAHARTRTMMASLEPMAAPQSVLDEVMRQARSEVAVPESVPWLERILRFLMQPAVATAFVFLMVASASLMLAEDPLSEEAHIEKQPYTVASTTPKKPTSLVESTEPVLASESEKNEPKPSSERVETLSVAAASAPVEKVAVKNEELRLAAAPRDASATRKKSAVRTKRKVDEGLRKVGIQLAEQTSGLSRKSPLAMQLEAADVRSTQGVLAGGLPVAKATASKTVAYNASSAELGGKSTKTDKSGSSGSRLLRTFRRQVKEGRYQEARRTLKALSKIPAFQNLAAREKKRLMRLQKTSSKRPAKGKKSKSTPKAAPAR